VRYFVLAGRRNYRPAKSAEEVTRRREGEGILQGKPIVLRKHVV